MLAGLVRVLSSVVRTSPDSHKDGEGGGGGVGGRGGVGGERVRGGGRGVGEGGDNLSFLLSHRIHWSKI